MFTNILIPTDGSDLSKKAARAGVELAKALGAKVTAFFAAPPATPIVYRNHLPVGLAQPHEHEQMIEKAAGEHLGFIEQLAGEAGVPFEGLHKTDDYAADAILQIADRKGCDIIVMATHGERGLRGMFGGSVTHEVVNRAKVPVLTLR